MKKPYAGSTLKRKYRETGLDHERLSLMFDYLNACAHFYQIIELRDVCRILVKQGGFTQEELDKVLPIAERDGSLDFYLVNEQELYKDGADKLLMIDVVLLLEDNEGLTFNAEGKPELVKENWDRFYQLDRERSGKPLFVPEDILPYAEDGYVEETPQTAAMEQFLLKDCRLNQRESWAAQHMNKDELVIHAPEEIVGWAVKDFVEMIQDFSVPMEDHIEKALEIMEDRGIFLKKQALHENMCKGMIRRG